MKNERLHKKLRAWGILTIELIDGLESSEDNEDNREIVNTLMDCADRIIKCVTDNNVKDGGLDDDQMEWLLDHCFKLLGKVHPAFRDLGITITKAPPGGIEQAIRAHASRVGAKVSKPSGEPN